VLVVGARRTIDDERAALIKGLLPHSGRRAAAGPARSLELTIVARPDVVPWRFPPRMDFQYGDWLRGAFERGDLAPWNALNPDLAVLLTTASQRHRVLFGPPPPELLDPVPAGDVRRAMVDGIPSLLGDLDGDEANVLLTLARIWVTLETGEIVSKDEAADWALARLPDADQTSLERARAVYLGTRPDTWGDLRSRVARDAEVVVAAIRRLSPGR
jgi:streptomycin 3"-adenylyltransferase